MPNFSANVSLLFTELPLLERFRAAKQHGFEAIEIQFPYEDPALELKSAIDQAGVDLIMFNVAAADLMSGGEGLAAVPQKRDAFLRAVDTTMQYAEILQPKLINVLPGRCLNPQRMIDYMKTFEGNLSYAADMFSTQDIKVVFEAVNSKDMPGFIVDSGQQMLDVLIAIDHQNLFMQYDIYHMHTMGENSQQFIPEHCSQIGHIQFADTPGRGQPGTGNIEFSALFRTIDNSDYEGHLGAEYKPTGSTSDSLNWLTEYD